MAYAGRTGDTPSVAVVGAGFGGLGTAIRLRQAGFHDLTLFERCEDLGAASRTAQPPRQAGRDGAPGDLVAPSGQHPANPWAPLSAAEIRRYLRSCAERFGLLPQIRLGTEVRDAIFDAASGRWQLALDDGNIHETDVLVVATGLFSWPHIPPAPAGTGRQVAVVGTGMHTAWLVRHLVPDVSGLWVFTDGPPQPGVLAGRQHLPRTRAAYRRVSGLLRRTRRSGWPTAGQPSSLRPPDPSEVPQARVTAVQPRILLSADRRPPVDRRRVRVVADRLTEIRPDGLVAAGGEVLSADVVLYTTGFTTAELLAPLTGAGGSRAGQQPVRLEATGVYLGVSIAHLPNLYLLYGPHHPPFRVDRVRAGEPGSARRVVRPAAGRR